MQPMDPDLLELHPVRLHNRITILEGNGERLTETATRLANLQEAGVEETKALREALREESDVRRAEQVNLNLRINAINEERRVEKLEVKAYKEGQQSIRYRMDTRQLLALVGGVGTITTAAAAIIALGSRYF